MSKKVSKKLSALNLNPNQVMDAKKCVNIKGGGWYFCCTRNRWIQY